MATTNALSTIDALRSMFATHGICKELVSDNGPHFTSEDYAKFCEINGIRRVLVSPYHPRSNGEAERFVQSFKKGMLTAVQAGEKNLRLILAMFLLAYRTTPHATTGESPAKLLFNRELRTRLDLVKPVLQDKIATAHSRQRQHGPEQPLHQFDVGERAWVRNYRGNPKWVQDEIVQIQGPLTYKVQVKDMIWKRHVDQLQACTTTQETAENSARFFWR